MCLLVRQRHLRRVFQLIRDGASEASPLFKNCLYRYPIAGASSSTPMLPAASSQGIPDPKDVLSCIIMLVSPLLPMYHGCLASITHILPRRVELDTPGLDRKSCDSCRCNNGLWSFRCKSSKRNILVTRCSRRSLPVNCPTLRQVKRSD